MDETLDSRYPVQTPKGLRIVAASFSHRGQVRTNNEDSVLLEPADSTEARGRGVLCVVADGMGGHAAGEVASALAVQTTRDRYYGSTNPQNDEALREAIVAANEAVWREAQRTPSKSGMGCTLSAAVVQGDAVVVGHVGDSRVYLVRHAETIQVTADHSWVAEQVRAGNLTVEQARQHPRRNVITRALGQRAVVVVDLYRLRLMADDVLVLCSDGLTATVEDREIGRYARELPPPAAVQRLVDLANSRGAPDNVTVAVMRVTAHEW